MKTITIEETIKAVENISNLRIGFHEQTAGEKVVDGFCRIEAARQLGLKEIPV